MFRELAPFQSRYPRIVNRMDNTRSVHRPVSVNITTLMTLRDMGG
jgi:hypothetical protein